MMIAITGATGQVGNIITHALLKMNETIRGIVRDPEKAKDLMEKSVEIFIADDTDENQFKEAFVGCDTAFLMTPENPFLENAGDEIDVVLFHYKKAVINAHIKWV